MNIGIFMMAHNTAPFIKAVINSLSWVDGIFLYDDNSNDGTAEIAKSASKTRLVIERSSDSRFAFERGEMEIRNYVLERAVEELKCDMYISVDADELLSDGLRPVVEGVWNGGKYDSVAFTIWHLYDQKHYLHFWETKMNGVCMVDPHTRVIGKERRFERLSPDGSHPILHATERTYCVHAPFHFHLKYFHKSPYPNYALNFLPKRLTPETVKPFIRELPFTLPSDIQQSLQLVEWDSLKEIETPYYDSYESKRVTLSDSKLALIHPKDKDNDI